MTLDRDLRDALHPFAGDPVADAARVLAALPPGPPPTGAPRWLPWTLLGGGLLCGFLLGFWIGGAAAPAEARNPPATAAPDRAAPGRPVPDLPDKTPLDKPPPDKTPAPKDQPIDPMLEDRQMLAVMAFGKIDIDDPVDGRQQVAPGPWRARTGTLFTTGDGQAGAYAYANDVSLRFDQQTIARFRPNDVELVSGQICVHCGSGKQTVRVDLGAANAQVVDGTAMFTRLPAGLSATGLGGKVVLRTARGETIALAPHERVTIDPERGAQPKERVLFLGTAMSWMTTMIEMSTDPQELPEHIKDMVAAFEREEFREAAQHELLKLGSRCVPALIESITRRLAADRGYALEAARLVAQIVDYRHARHALPLLLLDDPDLREIVFTGLRDATGTDSGTDVPFWRNARQENRQAAVDRWSRQLQK